MAYRKRIFFNDKQTAEIWDRWQRGESISANGRHFDRASSSTSPLIHLNKAANWSKNWDHLCIRRLILAALRTNGWFSSCAVAPSFTLTHHEFTKTGLG